MLNSIIHDEKSTTKVSRTLDFRSRLMIKKKKKKLSNGEVLTQVSQPYQSHAHIPNSQGLKDQ